MHTIWFRYHQDHFLSESVSVHTRPVAHAVNIELPRGASRDDRLKVASPSCRSENVTCGINFLL